MRRVQKKTELFK